MAYAGFSPLPEALYGTMFIEICKLSPRERHIILDVMLRDENLRRRDEQRIIRMKSELQDLRRRGALRTSEDHSGDDGVGRVCSRCRAGLGWIVNRGAVCQACRLRVCKACREYTVRTVDWVCTVCYKRSQIQTATGEWMNEFIKKPGQWKDSKFYISAADIIKSTIRRSWTICDPNSRWASSRDSPDFRPYNSLPRARDVTDYPSLVSQRSDIVPSSDSLERPDDPEVRSEGHSPRQRQRRISQFERTLSELYGTQKKSPRRMSSSDENCYTNGIDKTSPEDSSPSPASTVSPNGIETKRSSELKPSKIPSPRKKVQYTRSETAIYSESPKQVARKQNSLQPTKKSSKDKSVEENNHEKHVSFDDECLKKSPVIIEPLNKSESVTSKSGIPKRDLKSRSTSKSLNGDSEKVVSDIEIKEEATECDKPQIEAVNEEKVEVEPISGAVFRKVTIKKRRHEFRRTQHAFDEARRRHQLSESREDQLPECADPGKLLPDGEDYKLVFISSDSSSKEEDVDDNDSVSSSSATTAHSFTIDDCDWDYFEPSSVRPVLCWSNRNSPFGSPRVYRRGVVIDSPLGSPLVYRRARESDTGTDEDVTRVDSGSPASSDSTTGFLSRMRTPSDTEDHLPMDTAAGNVGATTGPCQSCGQVSSTPPTQYVPIPVLVPIPVPVPAIWNPLDPVILYNSADTLDGNLRARLRAIQQRTGALLWPCVNQASLISSLISPGGDGNSNTFVSLAGVQHSVCATADEADVSVEMPAPAATERNSPGVQPWTAAPVDASEQSANANRENDTAEPNLADDPSGSIERTASPAAAPADKCVTSAEVNSEVMIGGYLASENTYMSSSDSNSSSGDSDLDDDADKPRVRRTYNVNGGNTRESDDALPSSDVTSDGDEDETGRMSPGSDRNDDLSSSGTADTDSDDTGTVADQKPRKFCKVFVVNTNDSSSDIEDNTDSSDTDTSDNDTDTEQDCVVLNYIRSIDDTTCSLNEMVDNNNDSDNNAEPVVLLRHTKSEDQCSVNLRENNDKLLNSEKPECDQNSGENSVVLLKHVVSNSLQEISSDPLSTVSNKICVSESVCSKSNSLADNAACANNTTPADDSVTVSTIKNESENTVEQDIDLIAHSATCTGNNELQGKTTSEKDQRVVSPPALSHTELIGGHEAPTDCIARVSEESKQTANDLETRREPSPSDMKANDLRTTQISESVDNTPLKTSVNNKARECDSDNHGAVPVASGESAAVDSFPQEEKLDNRDNSKGNNNDSGEQSEVSASADEVSGACGSGSEWNSLTSAGIRSSDPVSAGSAEQGEDSARGARTGAPAAVVSELQPRHVPAARSRYTSLVMITQEAPAPTPAPRTLVNIVASDTTTVLPPPPSSVVVQHTNWHHDNNELDTDETTGLAGYFARTLDSPSQRNTTPRKPVHVNSGNLANNESVTVVSNSDTLVLADSDPSVTVVTGGDTLSAVVCLEEGLADDDSWVEDISHDEDEFATTTATDSSSGEEVTLSSSLDQEEELRGYHRSAIDFTLHTIVEESCEESEVEQSQINNKKRPTSATDLEKYFFFRLGDGTVPNVNEDAFSETSSIYSEGMDSLGPAEDTNNDGADPADLASSRLEKYFLSGFMGFTAERRDSDGSVGSDSEGRPSPEQRRKRLVRARGTGRSHSSSLDNLLANAELSGTEPQNDVQQLGSEDSSSSETDTYDEPSSNFEKSDGQFDTVKRKKCKKQRMISGGSNSPHEEKKCLETTMEDANENRDSDGDDDGHKTPQPEFLLPLSADLANSRKQQSRDSGFIGSCDDLLKEQKTNSDTSNSNETSPSIKTLELKNDLEKITEEKRTTDEKLDKFQHYSVPPATTLTRKDSFNNWSSDEETNLMMSKMRQFFKTMVANSSNAHLNPSSKPTTPILSKQNSPRPVPSPRTKNRNKPPQLVYFENELTRLMKTVPGIRDDQVREIVEYLSSEDTWSDSYDSSDYTSSDLETTVVAQKSALQQQISASCQQIINKFDKTVEDEEGDEGDGGILDESQGLNRETAFVYQKLVASFNKMTTGDGPNNDLTNQYSPHNSPPLIAKVMHHIGSRLVALMHEVSSGESHCSTSPKVRYHHRRLQQKLSSASTTTTEDDDSTSDSNLPEHLSNLEENTHNILPRSRSHDLLLGEARAHHQSSSGVSDIAEEREASDYERFSWRGSFESALMATDSRQKLSLLGAEGSASASALAMAAKRRSAGDLLFSPKSLSREQLDRVRSCGSIGGGGNSEEKHWVVTSAVRPNRRRSSVPDATCGSGGSADGEDDDDEDMEGRSTLPRSLQTNAATTNSLPRLPTSSTAANMHKAHSMHHFLQHNVKSARYRPPGFNRPVVGSGPKRAVSAPGLQPSHPRRDRRRSQQTAVAFDDVSITESNSSPIVGPKSGSKSASPSPIHGNTLTRGTGSVSSADWPNDDDIDRLVAMHQNRSSLSSLGLRSDSMASVYSGAGEGRYGIVAVRGQVEFGLQYNYKAGALEIHIKQCKDLAPVDVKRNRSDPYVKVYLLPDKSKSGKRKTKVKKHTLNPVFDECLKFHLSLSGLETRTLWLTVWHSDMFGRNDFLGEVMMPLENKVFDDPTPKWYNLQERTEPFEELPSYKGDVIIGLKFVPPDMTVPKKGKRSRGALHVLVKEAKCLTAVKANGTSDPFCKSYLLPDKGRSNKQKTPILRRTTNPVWNHTFIYDDVTLQELAERALELTVWDHDRIASNEFLGGVRFSLGTNKHYGKGVDWMDATGKELALWQSMLERPNFWVEGCVTLRSSLDNRNT